MAHHLIRADHARGGPGDILAPDRSYHPYLTGSQATGGLKEYGVRVAGTWEWEAERALSLVAA